jgi:hypothetical protein
MTISPRFIYLFIRATCTRSTEAVGPVHVHITRTFSSVVDIRFYGNLYLYRKWTFVCHQRTYSSEYGGLWMDYVKNNMLSTTDMITGYRGYRGSIMYFNDSITRGTLLWTAATRRNGAYDLVHMYVFLYPILYPSSTWYFVASRYCCVTLHNQKMAVLQFHFSSTRTCTKTRTGFTFSRPVQVPVQIMIKISIYISSVFSAMCVQSAVLPSVVSGLPWPSCRCRNLPPPPHPCPRV